MLNIYTLHYFYVTAQHLNFSRAAKHLYITQPALSKQIQQLEEQLQVKLFDRTKRSVKLTEAGLILLDHCAKIFQSLNNLEKAMDQFRKEVRGNLRVAATPSLGNYLLPDFLKEFSTQFPQIMLHTIFKPVEEVIYMLRTGELDFGLLNTNDEFEGIEFEPMQNQKLVFICSKNCEKNTGDECCPHAEESVIPAEQLECCRFISFSKSSLTRKVVDDVVRSHDIQLNTVIESENIEIIKSMVMRGMGSSVVPECTIRKELAENLFTVKQIDGVSMSRPVSLYYKKDLSFTKAHEEFLEIFRSFSQERALEIFEPDNRKKPNGKNGKGNAKAGAKASGKKKTAKKNAKKGQSRGKGNATEDAKSAKIH